MVSSVDGNNCGYLFSPRRSQLTRFTDECIYDQAEIDRVKYVYNAGHQVASHTWSHADLTTLTWDQSSSLDLFLRLRFN